MAKKRETRLQKKIQAAIKKRYGKNAWIMKVHGGPFQKDGIGDLILCVFGLFFMFEVKNPDNDDGATQLQLETVDDIEKAGGVGDVIISAEEAISLIDRALARARKCGFIRS